MSVSATQSAVIPYLEHRPVDVLLADELTLVREGLAALCNSIGGYRVVSQVGSAGAALYEIQRLQPTLALLDLGLSDLAATEVIRKVRDLHLVTRCAVFSTRKDRKTVLEVLRNGACGYVLKSSTPEQMAEALRQFARGGIYVSPQIEVMSLFRERSGTLAVGRSAGHPEQPRVSSVFAPGGRCSRQGNRGAPVAEPENRRHLSL